MTSQLITTRGKGKTNRYPDLVIHILLAPIVLLASFPRKIVFPILRGKFLSLFMPSTCETRPPHIPHGCQKRRVVKSELGQITGLPMFVAAGHSAP